MTEENENKKLPINLNDIVEEFRIKNSNVKDEKIKEDIYFRESSNSTIWMNNPNYGLNEKEIIDLLSSSVKIKGESVVLKDALLSPIKLNDLEFYAKKNSEPMSVLGKYKTHKKRLFHYMNTKEILKKEGDELIKTPFENGFKKSASSFDSGVELSVEDYIKELINIVDNKYIIYVDTETTGLSSERGDTAIQIYLLKTFKGRKISDLKLYIKTYKNPIGLESKRIHGIDESILSKEGLYPIEALKRIKEFIEETDNSIIFGHNVNFDLKMLEFMFNDWNIPLYKTPHLDTIEIIKTILWRKNPDITKANLDHLITKYLKEVDIEKLYSELDEYRVVVQNFKTYTDIELFKKDIIGIEKGILKKINLFLENEKKNDLLYDKNTNYIEGYYHKLTNVDNELKVKDKLGIFTHIFEIIDLKIKRRHQADYDVIQTFTIINKILKDYTDYKITEF